MSALSLHHVTPQAGVRGGQVTLSCSGITPQELERCRVVFGSHPTRPALITPTSLVGIVPEGVVSDMVTVDQQGRLSNPMPFTVATVLADNLHPVGNPAIDRQGNLYTTISGTKGQQVPISVYRLTPQGEVEPFATGIMNPTGLAFGPDGTLYVSSRHEGRLYRVNAEGMVAPFVEGLGIATGLTFDRQGRLYVGDRRGTIYQVSETGITRPFARLSPSVAAYHLAYGHDDRLYVSYPTLSGNDRLYRIAPGGQVEVVVQRLGRAQGLAFDAEHRLYLVAYTEGRGGVVQVTAAGSIRHVVSGVNLVGLAFSPGGELILADHSSLYQLTVTNQQPS